MHRSKDISKSEKRCLARLASLEGGNGKLFMHLLVCFSNNPILVGESLEF